MTDVERKGAYYSLKEKCRRVSRQLSLSLSEEEYDRHWKTYKGLVKHWKQLERQEKKSIGTPPGYWYYVHRPVFDEAYVESTLQLREMYRIRKAMSHSERHKNNDALRAAFSQRRETATFIEVQAGGNGSAVQACE